MKNFIKNTRSKQRGVTLLELMISVGILGVISSIALPTYSSYVIKTQRTDAKVALLKYAQIQESYFVQNLSYAKSLSDTAANGGLGLSSTLQSDEGKYDISLTVTPGACNGLAGANACTGFVLSAIPASGTTQTRDKACAGGFDFDNFGRKRAKKVTNTGSFTVTQGKKCW